MTKIFRVPGFLVALDQLQSAVAGVASGLCPLVFLLKSKSLRRRSAYSLNKPVILGPKLVILRVETAGMKRQDKKLEQKIIIK